MAKVIRTFTVEELEEDYDLPYAAVSNEEDYKARWYTGRTLVFKADDGLHYEVYYMDPATEMQEDQDRWNIENYKENTVNAYRVEPVEVKTVRWDYLVV